MKTINQPLDFDCLLEHVFLILNPNQLVPLKGIILDLSAGKWDLYSVEDGKKSEMYLSSKMGQEQVQTTFKILELNIHI